MKNSIEIPQPSRGARWRWASSRGALVGGGVLTAILSVGTTSAGASTSGHAQPPSSAAHGKPPSGQPTAGGKITALSTDSITIATMASASETITYSSTTTFRTKSGPSSASALAVGKFISVIGTKNSDGSVSAKSIMLGMTPPQGGGRGPGGRPGKGAPPNMSTNTAG